MCPITLFPVTLSFCALFRSVSVMLKYCRATFRNSYVSYMRVFLTCSFCWVTLCSCFFFIFLFLSCGVSWIITFPNQIFPLVSPAALFSVAACAHKSSQTLTCLLISGGQRTVTSLLRYVTRYFLVASNGYVKLRKELLFTGTEQLHRN